ncbi:MAG: phosphoribosylglycinamide formyltransferase [Ginsengibacter sp.]|jgi:formyltetrahydrofolate-dependent phosphoribosylglycinamide formyltransferase
MLQRLKKHWDVNTKGLVLILLTFAVTGTLTAWLSKKIAEWMQFDILGWAYWSSKIIVLIFGYQVIILIVGFCFGMFPFFWKYEKKILVRLGFMKKEFSEESNSAIPPKNIYEKRLAIFASGAGSNAQMIIRYFKNHPQIKIALIVCNQPKAGVVLIAKKEKIPLLLVKKELFEEHAYAPNLEKYKITHIILAGFLLKIPKLLIQSYPHRIINLHPALLPKYGGKGMYGHAVHQAVIDAKEKKSGITIHYVDEHYDTGKIIFQITCDIDEQETPNSLAQKIHQLEHIYYSKKIEKTLNNELQF